MNTKTNKLLIVIIAFAFNTLSAQIISPFNQLSLEKVAGNYTFIVSGHFHGESTNYSTFPASTLLAGIDTLNAIHPLFIMSLGDLFIDVDTMHIRNYDRSLFKKLKAPLFNAVGNHDISNGNEYEKNYGKTWYAFKSGSELFICLNTEVNDGSIENEQLDFLKETLKQLADKQIKNVIFFTHRPVWAENIERYKNYFADNTRTAIGSNNFTTVILPLLKENLKAKNVYWISGSIGNGPSSFFYDKNNDLDITFMQTAIRNKKRDAVLKVMVNNGNISFEGISLTGEKCKPIDYYNLDYWNTTLSPEQKFNFRLLPFLMFKMVTHHYFWIGFVTAAILLLILLAVLKKWKRKK